MSETPAPITIASWRGGITLARPRGLRRVVHFTAIVQREAGAGPITDAEVSAMLKTGHLEVATPAGWLAFEATVNLMDGTAHVVNQSKPQSRELAEFFRKAYADSYKLKASRRQEKVKAIAAPPEPPRGCANLSSYDLEKIDAAKRRALRRLWPRVCKLLSKSPIPTSAEFQVALQRAFNLDHIARHGKPASGPIPMGAAQVIRQYHRRKRKNMLALLDVVLAGHWDAGWCFLSETALADAVERALGLRMQPRTLAKRRSRLGLRTMRFTGPCPEDRERLMPGLSQTQAR